VYVITPALNPFLVSVCSTAIASFHCPPCAKAANSELYVTREGTRGGGGGEDEVLVEKKARNGFDGVVVEIMEEGQTKRGRV
jgi:hypothetical protein